MHDTVTQACQMWHSQWRTWYGLAWGEGTACHIPTPTGARSSTIAHPARYPKPSVGSTVWPGRFSGVGHRQQNRDRPEGMTTMGRVLVRWGYTLSNRLRDNGRDRGAGFVEYAGLLLLIVAIVVAVLAAGIDNAIADGIARIVRQVIS